jgi:hypothetical protein
VRAVPVAVVVGVVLVLASAAAARDPKAPQLRPTAADGRLARGIALTLRDLAPGWKAQPKQKPAPPCSTEPDESSLVQTAQIDPTFVWTDGVTSIGTEVDVFRTAVQAQRDWRLSTLRVIRDCLLEAGQRTLGKGVRVSLVSAQALPSPAHAARTWHYRLVFELRGKNTVPVVTDLIGVGAGRVSVVLHTFSIENPLPAKELTALAAKLVTRLQAGKLGI